MAETTEETPPVSAPPSRYALLPTVKSVGGGVALTLLTIGAVQIVSAFWFRIPQPSSPYLLAVVAAALLGGMRSGLISALIVFAFSAYITHEPGNHHLLVFSPEQTTRLALFGVTAPAMAILVGVLRRRNDDLLRETVRREIATERAAERAKAAARQAQADLDRERRIAVTLQSALLSPLPAETAFAGVGIGCCYEAAWNEAEVGGDFYDVFALDNQRIAVVVGDVSGKGLAAAAKTAEVKYTLRAVLYDLLVRHAPPGDDESEWRTAAGIALSHVNESFAQGHQGDSGSLNPSSLEAGTTLPAFVCLSVAILNAATGAGALVVAGMEPPVALRQGPAEIVGEILDAGGLPIGVLPDAAYDARDFRLAPGETLLFATDGVTESRRRGSPVLFGVDGLCRAAETVFQQIAAHDNAAAAPSPNSPAAPTTLDEHAARIVAAAKTFAGENTLKDDACVLLVRRQE